MKIYPVQHIAMLELAHRDIEPLIYKQDTYKGRKEDKWPVKAIISYKDINNTTQYKVQWQEYKKTIQEPKENLINAKEKLQAYYKKAGQVKGKKNCQ